MNTTMAATPTSPLAHVTHILADQVGISRLAFILGVYPTRHDVVVIMYWAKDNTGYWVNGKQTTHDVEDARKIWNELISLGWEVTSYAAMSTSKQP